MAGKSKIVKGALGALTDVYKKTFAPKTYYHYSDSPNIKEFDPGYRKSWIPGDIPKAPSRGATFFTSTPKYANKIFEEEVYSGMFNPSHGSVREQFEDYVDPKYVDSNKFAPTIYPVKIKTDKIFDYNNKKQVDDLINDLSPNPDLIRDGTWDDVVDLIRMGNWQVLEDRSVQKLIKQKGYRGYKTSEPETIGLFYPDKGDVRSIFAKFDPKKSKSGEILASVPIGALVTGGALSDLAEEDF
jgi:hypothetical protein